MLIVKKIMSYLKEINIQKKKYYEILKDSNNIFNICSIVQYNCKITITESKFIISSDLLDSTNKAYILLLDEFKSIDDNSYNIKTVYSKIFKAGPLYPKLLGKNGTNLINFNDTNTYIYHHKKDKFYIYSNCLTKLQLKYEKLNNVMKDITNKHKSNRYLDLHIQDELHNQIDKNYLKNIIVKKLKIDESLISNELIIHINNYFQHRKVRLLNI